MSTRRGLAPPLSIGVYFLERGNFSTRLGFILVSAGCAIGLGNVWRFPYITGMYGGASFVLIYLVFLAILGLPIMVAEFAVGRASVRSAAMSFDVLEPKGTKWHLYKYGAIAGNLLLMMYYTTISGWMLYYIYLMASGAFVGLDADGVGKVFGGLLADPLTMAGFMALSDKSDEQLIKECEEYFELLKKTFSDKGAAQSCAQLFALSERSVRENVDKMNSLYDTLKEAGRKFDKHYGLSVLAAVALCEQDVKTLTDTMLEIDEFLSKQKGYGMLSVDKQTRLLHAAMLTVSIYSGSENSKTATLAMLAAHQAAECAMIACVIIMSASSSSN